MPIRTFPPIRKQLTARSTVEEFEPFTQFYLSLEALTAVALVLGLGYKTGNFQCRLGIQTADKQPDGANTPVNPAAYSAQITSGSSSQFMRFDPNGASDGNIDASILFRLGVFYSLSSGSTVAVGEVEMRYLCWR